MSEALAILKLTGTFFRCLPELIKLVEQIQKAAQEAAIERKVHEDVKTISNAFATGNADALNDLFANRQLRQQATPDKL
jgi:hypothetical protein